MEQNLKFSKLYKNCKRELIDAASAMWCGNSHSSIQEAYSSHIKTIVQNLFVPENAMPLVECMDPYESIEPEQLPDAKRLVRGLWDKTYLPYKHQYKCWQVLREGFADVEKKKVKSIVVTTGTGSGKTECFMDPLVADLLDMWDKNPVNGVKAIFLYPLNALMEDQKLRLQELLNGTDLHFAVYNGNLVENDPGPSDQSLKAETDRARLSDERRRFPNILATRKEMRRKKPDILLTNPTMLEYILLRNKDRELFENSDLSWVVIDETHSYTGAGAAELALLMRRVLMAFGVSSDTVRFATSSATIGNGDVEDTGNKLKKFICDISGQLSEQIEIVEGKRTMDLSNAGSEEILCCRQLLNKEGYVPLDLLIPGQMTIEDRLERLDALCEDSLVGKGLQVKLHFFYHVPDKGFTVKLNDFNQQTGLFQIHTEKPIKDTDHVPYLKFARCKCCGEYLAIGQSDSLHGSNSYRSPAYDDNNLFDAERPEYVEPYIFGLLKEPNTNVEGNTPVKITDSHFEYTDFTNDQYNIILNINRKCPYCGVYLGKNARAADDSDLDFEENAPVNKEITSDKVQSFNISAVYVRRLIAPVLCRARATSVSMLWSVCSYS